MSIERADRARALLRGRYSNRWISWLFIVGSICFALGSAPSYAQLVDPPVVGVTFFTGSLFFTSAALLQYLLAVTKGRVGEADPVDRLATAIQLAGIEPGQDIDGYN